MTDERHRRSAANRWRSVRRVGVGAAPAGTLGAVLLGRVSARRASTRRQVSSSGGTFVVDFGAQFKGTSAPGNGLGSGQQVIEHREGGSSGQEPARKLPGLPQFPILILSRSVTSDLGAWQWRRRVLEGQISTARTDGTVTFRDRRGRPVAQWTLLRAWPSNVAIATDDYGIVREVLEIAYDALLRTK